jgi:hypothetical protein
MFMLHAEPEELFGVLRRLSRLMSGGTVEVAGVKANWCEISDFSRGVVGAFAVLGC